ncbi:MAG: hypothetical protein ABI605_16725 [Rhizobacter sp.]
MSKHDPSIWEPIKHHLLRLDEARTRAERRAALLVLESTMALEASTAGMPQEECPLREHFAPGLYSRQIFMRAGLCVVGKIHKHAHMNTVSKGACIVFTEHDTQRLDAGDTFVSLPGTKRAVFMLEDVLWTTTHANPTDSRDSAWLESQLIAPSFDALELHTQLKVTA